MNRERLTPKAVKLQQWISPALDLLTSLQLIDDELFIYEKKPDEYDGAWIQTASADTQTQRRETNKRLVHYRLTITDMIRAMDLSDLSPKMQALVKRYAYLRYYRGLPVTRKSSAATIEKKMGLSRSMLALINRVALNHLALVWDESEPPV